jgi:cyclin B
VADLFQHLYQAEARDAVTPYMDSQPDINSKMRAILIDWLVEVHMKFRLVPETLYLCVNLIDRYCIMADIRRSELQLVGVTALLIACKYEEIYPPEVRDCVYITDRAYNRQQVLDMEQDILDRLEFRITVPTAHPFLGRYLDLAGASDVARHTASFYMERTLQEHDLLHHRPSMVALAAVLLEYTGFEADGVREVAALICSKVEEEPVTASRRQLVAVKRKFDADKYLRVSSVCAMPRVSHLD